MKKLSLKTRLILFFSVIAGIMLCCSAFFSWQESTEKTNEFFDTYQTALARQLAAADWTAVHSDKNRMNEDFFDKIEHADTEDEAIGFAVFNASGKMIFHDGENGRYFPYEPKPEAFSNTRVDDEKWRLVWIPTKDSQFMVAVGQELDYRTDIAWDMMETFTLPWLIGMGSLLIFMIIIITLEFWPMKRLAVHLRNRNGDDLSPLSDDRLPTEVKPLIQSMNLLLGKIQSTLDRERRFIADSAHELRTPLTALKVQLEIAQLATDDDRMRSEALTKLSTGIDRASRLVEQLLALSRAESEAHSDTQTRIDWHSIIHQMISDYQQPAQEKNIMFKTDLSDAGPFSHGNPILAGLIIRNLVDNAVRYSPNGATVQITLRDYKLIVLNTGTHVEDTVLERLTHRFYRPAGQKESGSGLGLSIVDRITRLYKSTLTYRNTSDGFEVTVSAQEPSSDFR